MSERKRKRPAQPGSTPEPASEAEPVGSIDAEELEELLEIAGEPSRGRPGGALSGRYVDRLGELTDVDLYEGELEAGVHDDLPTEPDEDNLELLTELELRGGETDNPDVAAGEGMTYLPPTDPPVVPSDDEEGLAVGAGFGTTALDEPYDEDHHSGGLDVEQEIHQRIHEALRADATTSFLADLIVVGARGGRVVLRGVVDDLVDAENAVAVVERVEGVVEVIDELDVRALEGR